MTAEVGWSGRTEVEVATDTIAILICDGLLTIDVCDRAAALTGVTTGEIREALKRVKRRGAVKPRAQSADVGRTARDRALPGRYQSEESNQRRRRPTGPNGELRCSLCKEWKPEDQFGERASTDTGYQRRKSRCNDCLAEAAKQRYLSLERKEAMNAMGLTFIVQEGDETVGLACVECGQPFLVDDVVHGVTHLQHDCCEDR